MLHVWLIPALLALLVVVGGFYWLLKYQGGSGIRTDGRTLADKPAEEEDLPPK